MGNVLLFCGWEATHKIFTHKKTMSQWVWLKCKLRNHENFSTIQPNYYFHENLKTPAIQ